MTSVSKLAGKGNTSTTLNDVIAAALEGAGTSRKDLTVLSPQVDPYRFDTPAGHRDGAWVAGQLAALWTPGKKFHWRGLHYALVQSKIPVRKPDGSLYRNTDDDWEWLTGTPSKAARWLGYVPFDRIHDQRNAPPIIHRKARVEPQAYLSVGLDIEIPDIEDIEPMPVANGFVVRQAYHFAIFGEKSSLEDVVLPIAKRHDADLYLPTGEISDTLIYQIASDANRDGRPLVMFTLSDCDPSGRQMPVSIGRKLQAFKDLLFPDLRFEVVPVALTPEQVKAEDLASAPMKEGEKRADRWFEAFGIHQTEIDSLTTPSMRHVLARIVEQAFKPYHDRLLVLRVEKAKLAWYAKARQVIADGIDAERLDEIRTRATEKLETLRTEIDAINEALQIAASTDTVELPEVEVPEASPPDLEPTRQGLVFFDDDWVTASRALIEHKSYGK
jgi:hypothetical protein